jgi:TolA-binding protein
MTMRRIRLRYLRSIALASSGIAMLFATVTAGAQTDDSAARIDRLERQLRAVQSRVFPGGQQDPLFRPQGATPSPVTPDATGPGTNPPSGDMSSRLDAIEAQLARLTGDVEQMGFRQRQLDETLTRLRSEYGARFDRIDPPVAATPTPTPAATPTPSATPAPAPTPAPRPVTPSPAPRPTASPAASPPSLGDAAARRARVAALEQPATGDAGEDAYLFGFRLWDARLYPEAQAQLQRVIERYPSHRRASYAGNLLGRAYLDNDQPTLAVRAFYDNYRNRPRGERAAESVYYMGMALIRLDRQADACRTFGEFDRSYGATAAASLKAQVARGRTEAGC